MNQPDPILLCLEGRISAEVAIARLLLGGAGAEAILRRIQDAPARNERWGGLAAAGGDLHRLMRLRAMIDRLTPDHASATTPAAIAALFDAAVGTSPEASVALYSLGDPAILNAATGEILTWLDRHRLIGPRADVLDLGCGIGRMTVALAGKVRSVLGIDVSDAMVREAELRCAGLPNVGLAVTTGADLAPWPDDTFDLVLAVDSFPYLVQAGVAEQHVAEGRRVLRPGGALAILNLSYCGDARRDREDATVWAIRHGLQLRVCDDHPFRLWDAAAYILVADETDSSCLSSTHKPV
ncbi:MAG TPA: class I SAM-dependent methyltransferase [Rhodopila sp.]|nr:class I SAM-dependent methyltransferase [Rhodopila sp.]